MRFSYAPGATPLDPDETDDLIPKGVSLRADLDPLEQANIMTARRWAFNRRHRDILTLSFLCRLHRKMFDAVWRWAGSFRRTDKNIGVDKYQISFHLQQLCDNTTYWFDNAIYEWVELGARFHHRLVWVHAFPNGNGRHARLMTDLLLYQHGQKPFTWGGTTLDHAGDARKRYLNALRAADSNDMQPLISFVRSR